jgi:hypothetical protein
VAGSSVGRTYQDLYLEGRHPVLLAEGIRCYDWDRWHTTTILLNRLHLDAVSCFPWQQNDQELLHNVWTQRVLASTGASLTVVHDSAAAGKKAIQAQAEELHRLHHILVTSPRCHHTFHGRPLCAQAVKHPAGERRKGAIFSEKCAVQVGKHHTNSHSGL